MKSVNKKSKYVKKQTRSLDNWSALADEIIKFIEKCGTPGVMPTRTELHLNRRKDLIEAVIKHGAWTEVAKRLGLVINKSGFSRHRRNVLKRALYSFMSRHNIIEVMPTKEQLLAAKQKDLLDEIEAYGGIEAVAQLFALKTTK